MRGRGGAAAGAQLQEQSQDPAQLHPVPEPGPGRAARAARLRGWQNPFWAEGVGFSPAVRPDLGRGRGLGQGRPRLPLSYGRAPPGPRSRGWAGLGCPELRCWPSRAELSCGGRSRAAAAAPSQAGRDGGPWPHALP